MVLIAHRKRLPRFGPAWLAFVIMAVVGNCVPFWLISWGQQRIDSGLAGILMAVMPLATLVLAHLFVAGERLTRGRLAGFFIGFLGIVVLLGPDAMATGNQGSSTLLAQLAVLGGACCYAVNAVIARLRPAGEPLAVATGVLMVSSTIMLPLAALETNVTSLELPADAAAAVAALGVVSTAVATVVYFRLISIAGPTFLSLINYLIPLWAVLAGAIVLDEQPQWHALLALFLVLTGITISEISRARKKRKKRTVTTR
jgi:drug/metabolite transporter (DMT)-like permease